MSRPSEYREDEREAELADRAAMAYLRRRDQEKIENLMNEIAELRLEIGARKHAYMELQAELEALRGAQPPIAMWTRKDGTKIAIKDMTTDHLRHSVAMLRRKGFVTEDTYLSCLAYAYSGDTPDGASMAAESEAGRMKVSRSLSLLEDELATRGGAR